jgi:hypothetical protein
MTKRITGWSISVVWDDGTEEALAEMPYFVSRHVDDWLTQVEEMNSEEDEDATT